MPSFQQLDNCNARAPTCRLSRSRSTPRSRWRKSAWQARPQPTHRNYCTSTYCALVVFKAVFQLSMESWTEQNIRRRPASMICLCRSASSAYDLEDVFAQQDQNRSEKKKLQKAWIPSDLSQNHPQPGPSKTPAISFNLPRWDGWRWSYWGRTPLRSSRILCCSQQTAAHWLLKQHRLLPFS